jgi:adenylate cyclase class 2
MCVEIEAKLKVDSHEEIAARLAELGAKFCREQQQTDYYFDDAARTLTNTDQCLRLRLEKTDQTQQTIITYKGPRAPEQVKKRAEVEVEVADAAAAEKLLSALGYQRVLVVEKSRRIWQLGGCEVALDELPAIGCFVEIEGPDPQKIADIQQRLGLQNLPHIPESYAALAAAKMGYQNPGT